VQLALEACRLAGELADTTDVLLGDPDPRGGVHTPQAPGDLLQLPRVVHLAWRDAGLQRRVEDHEVPAQLVGEPGDLMDVSFAVVAEQPDLHRGLVQERAGEPVDALPEDRPGD